MNAGKGKRLKMNDQRLSGMALSMLESTNPYNKEVGLLYYHATMNRPGDEVRTVGLCSLVEEKLDKKHFNRDARYADRNNKEMCFTAIGRAMVEYVDSYPGPSSFKRRMRETFIAWLEKLKEKYEIRNGTIPEHLYLAEGEKDMRISLIKSLHKRRGVTKKELTEELGIHQRSVMKNISRLDPSFSEETGVKREEEKKEKDPYMIGGQVVRLKVSSKKVDGEREKRYITYNTLHPLILLENVMQVGTLLKGLECLYENEEGDIAKGIAIDIWSQLSEFGRERIKRYYFDETSSFINDISDETPDEHAVTYLSERAMKELMEQEGRWLSDDDKLLYYAKASEDRICPYITIVTDDGEKTLTDVSISLIMGKKKRYLIRSVQDGQEMILERKDIAYLE